VNKTTALRTGIASTIRAHRELLIVAAAYLAAVTLIVPPTGVFPTCDDWDYSETAIGFARTGRLHLGYWPAMTLVTQKPAASHSGGCQPWS